MTTENIQKALQEAPSYDQNDGGLYRVYDAKAEAFEPPIPFKSDGTACRWFMGGLKKADSPLAMFPADYTLFAVAHYSDVSGIVTAEIAPREIMTGLEAKKLEGITDGR